MPRVNLSVRRAVILMWIATAFTLGLNIYAAVMGNPILIGVGLGVALSYSIAGILLGLHVAMAQGQDIPPSGR